MERNGRKPIWLRFLLITSMVVFYGICLAAGSLFGFIGKSTVFTSTFTQIVLRKKPQEVFDSNHVTLLILGCDEDRYYAGRGHSKPGAVIRHASRSDMMLVTKIDFANNRISAISIPRDLAWSVPGYRVQKINAYHAIGANEGGPEKGKELAKQAAEGVTGVKIDRVVVLNFDAFKQMVDILGGLEQYVPRNMDYDDNAGDLHIHLKKGRQTLSGYDAMCYVRYRHGDSDFKRQERQKDLMMSFKDSVLKHLDKSAEVADKSIALLGNAFTPDEIAALMMFGKKVGGDNIKMDMVPVIEVPGSSNLELDGTKLAEKLKELHMDSGTQVSLR